MPSISLSMTDEQYELLKKMRHEWILQSWSQTVERFMKLGWAHWDGCLKEGADGGK